MAATAARDIIHVLPKAYEHGDHSVQEIMLIFVYSWLAFQCLLGLCTPWPMP